MAAFRILYSSSSSSSSSCFCLFFVAMAAGLCYTAQGLDLNLGSGFDLCKRADYPMLCRAVVKGQKTPSMAMDATIRKMMFQTKRAMTAAQQRKSSNMGVCLENYDDAYTNLETCLSNLHNHDKDSLNINLSAALTDYVTCDDSLAEVGFASPVARINALLREMAANGLFLSDFIH